MTDRGSHDCVQGRVPGCPGQFTPTACPKPPQYATGYLDLALDHLNDLGHALEGWSAPTWERVEAAAAGEASSRGEVRGIALCCAESCQRDAIIPYAQKSVAGNVPATSAAGTRQAIADAVLAMMLADVLPAVSYAVLTSPFHAASPRARNAPSPTPLATST